MHVLDKFRFCPVCGSKRFIENNEKSKHCEDCGFTYYLNPSAAVAAFIHNSKGELLVVRRKKDPARGTLDLPGGFTDIGETIEETVRREVMEETRLTVSHLTLVDSIPNRYVYSGFCVPTLDFFFVCEVEDTTLLQANDDAEEALWLSLDQLQAEDFGLESIRKAVERYIKRKKEK